jgi:hypothetical protein
MVARVRIALDSNLYPTAIPPASSLELFILLPEESLSRLERSASFARDKFIDAEVALALLFTTIGMF